MIPLSHHAVLVFGDESEVLLQLQNQLGVDFTTTADADIVYARHETLGIDEARALALRAQQKPIARPELRLISVADAITPEAQNALLKLTEDPPLRARFVFVVPPSFPIISTFRSRCIEYRVALPTASVDFFQGTIGETLERVVRMSKEGDGKAMEGLLTAAERELHEDLKSSPYADAVIRARMYIEARGASAKMLLEDVVIARAASKRSK